MSTTLEPSFGKKLITLLIPITIQQIMMGLVGLSDTFMLGFLEQDALSAAALANQVTFILALFIGGMNGGLSIFAAQYWGKRDLNAMERYFAYAMRFTAIVCFGFFLAALLVPEALMRFYTPDPILIEKGATYLRYVSPTFFLNGVAQMYICILKNSDRAQQATLISSTSVILNILLNAVLIFGLFGAPRLGIAGAAIASVLARIVETVWCMRQIAAGPIKLRGEHLRQAAPGLPAHFWRYTLPVLLNSVIWGVAFTMYSFIMGRLGKDAVAANAIANTVKGLVSSFIFGLGGGTAIIIGNELGAGRLDQAKTYASKLLRIASLAGLISGLINLAVTPIVLQTVQLTPEASDLLKWMMVISSYNIWGMAINIVTFNGIFAAGGDGRFGFICDTITMWVVILPLGFLAAFVLKLPVLAVFFVLYLDELIKLPAVMWNYRKERWVKDLTVL